MDRWIDRWTPFLPTGQAQGERERTSELAISEILVRSFMSEDGRNISHRSKCAGTTQLPKTTSPTPSIGSASPPPSAAVAHVPSRAPQVRARFVAGAGGEQERRARDWLVGLCGNRKERQRSRAFRELAIALSRYGNPSASLTRISMLSERGRDWRSMS